MNRSALILSPVVAILLLISGIARADEPARVEVFSPRGTVKRVRQVTARFSVPMVPLGDPRVSDPFVVECPAPGHGRWADGRHWAYDFEEDLPAGISCTFTLNPGLKSLSGNAIGGDRTFSFSTGGPAILHSIPREGNETIDENQAFILLLDAAADERTILDNVSFTVEGVKEAVGVRFVTGEDRRRLLEAGPARALVTIINRLQERATTLEFRRKRDLADDPRIVILQARQSFPPNALVRLVWGPGVRATTGIATDNAQVLPFRARKPFTVRFECPRENRDAACIPLFPMKLVFNAPVSRKIAETIVLIAPGDKMVHATFPSVEEGEGSMVFSATFEGPFPEMTAFSVKLPPGFHDDSGRIPVNLDRFPLGVATDSFPPLAKFPAPFGIIESAGEPLLPVTLRNLETQVTTRMLEMEDAPGNGADRGTTPGKAAIGAGAEIVGDVFLGVTGRAYKVAMDRDDRIVEWMRRVARVHRSWDLRGTSLLKGVDRAKEFSVPKPGGEKAFEVVGIPLREPGFYVVEMESRILGTKLLGADRPMFVPTAALVTDLAAHLKRGRESSAVWVTRLSTGEPVKDAAVTVRTAAGKPLWEGRTGTDGIAWIRQELADGDRPRDCWPFCGLFVTARTKEDMTFLFSDWDDGIEPWRFRLPRAYNYDPTIAHTVFDRTLLRAGETVSMKHFLRRHGMEGIFLPGMRALPKAVVIEHEGSDQRYEFSLSWSEGAIAETSWEIPREAKLGRYGVYFLAEPTKTQPQRTQVGGYRRGDERYFASKRWRAGSFRVEEYRVPLMRGVIQAPGGPLVRAKEAELDLQVSYLSGGGASKASVTLRTDVLPRYVHFPDYGEFVIANGEVREGIFRGDTTYSRYDDGEESEETEETPPVPGARKTSPMRSAELVLDDFGAFRTRVTDLPASTLPRDLVAELEYRDPNGEVQTVVSRIPLWPSRVLVGIKPDSWAASKEAFKFHVLVLDLSGKPVRKAAVDVDLYQRKWYTHRKRLIGGFYSFDHVTETRRVGPACRGETDEKGLLICEIRSPVSGNVILVARARDDEGNEVAANRDVWIAGKDEWWFDVSDNDRIDLLPERKRYEPGEKAKFQVRMPFREATALVTVEREGIVDAFVTRLSGKNPVVEIPVSPRYAPNVFVSALCVRGRIEGVTPTATIDLGKPAFKLGVTEIRVGWKPHEIKVDVSPDRDVYKVREKARVRVRARRASGGALPKEAEVAIAAVDEGLLELAPNESWDLLKAMMGRRPYEVGTATAQMQVVGKRHFGLKALPQGGGGGKQRTRELFDTLLYWKGRVSLDGNGEAVVEIPLNDSITGFRIAAVASAGPDLFGSGEASIRTTQDLMVLSGLPPLVREGDRFRANFTVRNGSEKAMEVSVGAAVKGGAKAEGKSAEGADLFVSEFPSVSFPLRPGEARDAGWDTLVPPGADALEWEVAATVREGKAVDRIRVKQRVIPAVPVRTFQATISQVAGPLSYGIEKPVDALPGKGGVDVSFRARLSEGLGAVRYFMEKYPYTCLEQKVSRAVALRDASLWVKVMTELPAHLDGDGLAKYFPNMILGSDVLTSYLVAIADEAGWTIPADPRERMAKGLEGFIEGRVVQGGSLPTADLSIRKMAALEALSRLGRARQPLLDAITLEPSLWPTSAVIDWMNVLLRTPGIRDRDGTLSEAEQILRSRLNFQGTTMGFSTERTDYLWWLMVSGDVNAVRGLLTFLAFPAWEEDMPRIVNGTIARQRRGAWNTTVANAWGVLAMEKFSAKFETVPVSGISTATLENERKPVDWRYFPDGTTVSFRWPPKRSDLAISHEGPGKPWATVRSLAAIPLEKPLSAGYRIRKTMTPVLRKENGKWSRGDVIRVTLDLEAQSDMTWVVVSDPVPAGATILGTGLGRDSLLLTKGEKTKGLAWPAFTERSFEAFRAYYEFVPKGKWTVEYTYRMNNGGTFLLPPTRVEALYAPEMFGEAPNGAVEVRP